MITTLAQTDARQIYHINLMISPKIQTLYTPITALLNSLGLEWCAGTMLGLIIFICNTLFNRSAGPVVASAVALLDMAVMNCFSDFYYRFSPASLARLSILDPMQVSLYPSTRYAWLFFAIGISVLIIVSILAVRKQRIRVLPPI